MTGAELCHVRYCMLTAINQIHLGDAQAFGVDSVSTLVFCHLNAPLNVVIRRWRKRLSNPCYDSFHIAFNSKLHASNYILTRFIYYVTLCVYTGRAVFLFLVKHCRNCTTLAAKTDTNASSNIGSMYYRPYVILKHAYTHHILTIEEIFGGSSSVSKAGNRTHRQGISVAPCSTNAICLWGQLDRAVWAQSIKHATSSDKQYARSKR